MNKGSATDNRLPKYEVIRKQDDFAFLFRKGCRFKGHALHFYYRPASGRRVGFAVPKRLGNAVVRNRYKRWLREIYRTRRDAIEEMDLVILVKESARKAGYSELEAEYNRFVLTFGSGRASC